MRKNLGLEITAGFALGVVFVLSAIFFSVESARAVNQQITFQGKLTDTNSYNVANGTYYLKLTIYDAASGGSCVYSASSTCAAVTSTAITVTNGIFSINLGDTSANLAAMPATLFNNPALYLGITICSGPGTGCDSEMTPRKRITAAPYAFNADYLGGVTTSTAGGDGSYIPATDSSGNLRISNSVYVATSTSGQFGVGTSTVPSGVKAFVESTTASDKLLVVRGNSSQTGNAIELQNSAGKPLSYFDYGGALYLGGGTVTSTVSSTTLAIGSASGFNLGKFYVDASGNTSVSGTLAVFKEVGIGIAPTGNAQLYIKSTSTTAIPFQINNTDGYLIASIASSSVPYFWTPTNQQLNTTSTVGMILGDTSGLAGYIQLKGNSEYPSGGGLIITDTSNNVRGQFGGGQLTLSSANFATSTLSSAKLMLNQKDGFDEGKFYVDSAGKISASGSLTVWSGSYLVGATTMYNTLAVDVTTDGLYNLGKFYIDASGNVNASGTLFAANVQIASGSVLSSLGANFFAIATSTTDMTGKFYVDSAGNVSASGSLTTGAYGNVQYNTVPTSTLRIYGSINSSSTLNIPGLGNFSSRLYWRPEMAAFRAGIAGSEWDSPYVGLVSVAFGGNTYASGTYSSAFGNGSIASGNQSAAFGKNTNATGTTAFAAGSAARAGGETSFAFGSGVAAFGSGSFVFGSNATSSATDSFAFGNNVKVTNQNSFIFGRGDYSIDNAPLTNNILESFMVGFSTSSNPALMVYSGGTCSQVGIATTTYAGCGPNTYRLLIDANGSTNAGLGVLGYIKATGAITPTTGLDLAEKYPIDPACKNDGTCPEAGEIVAVKDSGLSGIKSFYIHKATTETSEQALGVVSTLAGFILSGGLDETNSREVALAGRVPVKVTTENGIIKVGDRLTLSSTVPGTAMKAVGNVITIGVALENYASVNQGKILVFVNMQRADRVNPETLVTQADGGKLSQGDLDLAGYSILNIKSIAGKDNKWVIDENGWLINNLKVSTGEKKVYGMSSENAELTLSGSGQLVNGEAMIEFETATKEIISSAVPLKVSATLTSPANGVYVSEKGDWGFMVKELNNGTSNATFDWVVIARRKTQAEIDNVIITPASESPAETPTSTPEVEIVPDVPPEILPAEVTTSTP